MNRKNLIIIALLLVSLVSVKAQEIIAQWPMGDTPGQQVISDTQKKFNLTQYVAFTNGCYSGWAQSYWKTFDEWNSPWSLEGVFKTNGEANSVMVLAGTRSKKSAYSGWDVTMLRNGVMRFYVSDSYGKSKQLLSATREFDDGQEHRFKVSWNPQGNQMELIIDKYRYTTTYDNKMDQQSGRIFYIGAQPLLDNAKTVPFKGELKNFVYKGKLQKNDLVQSLETLDKELALKKEVDNSTLWVDAKDLTIEGIGWKEGIEDYTRIPEKYRDGVGSKIWALSRHSAGVSVRFTVSGTAFINADWNLRGNGYMAHMTPQGVNGLDLYVKLDGKWVWAGVGKPTKDGLQQVNSLKGGFSQAKTYECMVYLPLYSGITSLKLGFSPGAKVEAAQPSVKKPLVFYGTSITHGCSASRAGMAFTSILGRRFDIPVVNLGFSGNGLMDSVFVDILSEIDASVYVIDCLANMAIFSSTEITNRTLYLTRELHKKRPDVPIVLIEDRTHAYANLSGVPVVNERRIAMKKAYDILVKEIPNLYYIEGESLLGEDTEATVDGSHPSDLGMYRYAVAVEPTIAKALCCNRK
ncbi:MULTISPECIES: SGNH/GDSL hydrolase family protein [Bacteroidales]|uniref:SGNH/GDSL hydrolase family protein n=1 Tax=Bacteroidales TaxID=171549 RepID=UPI00214C0455|nr:SGNH/GDSL hydrolase family protein [Gabonia massiliensis]